MKKAPVLKRTLPTRTAVIERVSTISQRPLRFVDRRPLFSFFLLLGGLVALIALSNFLNRPQVTKNEEVKPVKAVSVYHIGSAPKITVQAQTKKSGVIEITALTGGVIDELHVQEGMQVDAGTPLVSMSSNYKGENTATLERKIANQRYQSNASTYKTQREIITRQKELAEAEEENKEELREILEQSISETRTLLDANEESLRLLDEQIKELEQAPITPAASGSASTPVDVRNLKQQRALYINSINQTRNALRTSEYNADDDNAPSEIAELTKEIAIKQLEVQEKQLAISVEVSWLESRVAAIRESLMFPSAPFAGTVQRVFVKEKQQVSPGTPLMVFSQISEEDPISAVAFVSADVARRVSRMEPSTLHIGDQATYTTIPTFVSTEAVQGTLYAIYYPIPDQYNQLVVSEGFITVDIPIGYADTSMLATYIPLDSVYQTRDSAYVFVTRGNIAESRTVQLGQVYGRFVEIISGLKNGDTLILNRNIIAGDFVKVQ